MKTFTFKIILLGIMFGIIWPAHASIHTNTESHNGLVKKDIPEVDVSGTVKDANGETLIGVNVLVKGTTKGTSTDFDGEYIIEEVADDAVLQFSYVGYRTLEVNVDGQAVHDVVLN